MNIEGAEEFVIEGMENATNIIDNIAVSCHDFLYKDSEGKINKKVSLFLTKNGFDVTFDNVNVAYRDSRIYGTRNALSE